MVNTDTEEPQILEPRLLLGAQKNMYEQQEVFGAGEDSPRDEDRDTGGSEPAPAPKVDIAVAPPPPPSSGLGVPGNAEDECVVCLANGKEVLLLPCRHLCVCRECFSMIDKCPVCRAGFEEYVKVDKEHATHLVLPQSAIPPP